MVRIVVEAVMLTGGTPFSEIQSINSRLIVMASSSGAAPARGPDIKLCYVTVSFAAIQTFYTSAHRLTVAREDRQEQTFYIYA